MQQANSPRSSQRDAGAQSSSYKIRPRNNTGSLSTRLTQWADRAAFSWKVREALYRHLSAQIGNGVPVEMALDKFCARLKRQKKPSSEKIVMDVSRRMKDGSSLCVALQNWVPPDESSVIEAGELAGTLPNSLNLVVEAKRRIARVQSAIISGLTAPAIYVVAIYAMLWTIGRFVVPSLQQAMPSEKAQGLVYALYIAGDFANSWFALLPPFVVVVFGVVVIRSLPRWKGSRRIVAENFFPYSFYRDIQGYTWLMSFTALLRAGMPDVEILKRQKGRASPWLHERLHAFWWRMDNGSSFPEALLSPGKGGVPAFGFPNPDVVDDISSLAGFSDSSDRIAKLAIQWADELEEATLAKAKKAGTAVELFMYSVMGFLMIAINSLSTQMGAATNF